MVGLGLASVASLVVGGCGNGEPVTPEARAQQSPPPPIQARGLATGLTDFSPYLLGPVPGSAVLRPWQARAGELQPAVIRLSVLWSQVQPRSYRPPNWSVRERGCARGLRPCVPWAGVRAQLRAIRARRRVQDGGPDVLVVISSTPPWANRPRFGCQAGSAHDEVRPVALKRLPDYRRLIQSLLAAARVEGVPLRWWSAWNEPNTASFVNPQRLTCSPRARSIGPSLYTPLVRMLKSTLDAAPGTQEVVLGELSSPYGPRPRISDTGEFVRGLPNDVVCAGPVWSQHQYVGDADDLPELQRLVDERNCPGPPRRFWITETGVGKARPGQRRNVNPRVLKIGCQRQNGLLLRWYSDPRTDVAIQYTFREDPFFTTGLASARLTRLYPAFALWRAWGQRAPGDPPPALPPTCV